ncbi:MAG: GGDEF domain-containing phosphodiesterase, partial [Gaiellaceae bacterium]|nr:GGDEF domain-containing phosphodiesterase [Gaiellaceae bacterium]
SSVELDASVGWAIHPVDGDSVEKLLERADAHMYERKHGPSDGVVPLERRIDPAVVRDVELALKRSELVVLYQPVLDLRSGAPHSAEALVRRLRPNRTHVPPSDFVPHVERTALVRDLTLLVVEDALAARELWAAAGTDLAVRVNVPLRLLDDRAFLDALAAILRRGEMPPERLTLEVSPTSVGAGSSLDPLPLGRLAKLGVRLSLDDGGRAGSIAALRAVPFHALKIDAGLVHGIGRSAVDAAIVHGLVEIGRSLGIPVVAEGVETRETWRRLASWDCELAQGFFVAAPQPAQELAAWLGGRWPAVA